MKNRHFYTAILAATLMAPGFISNAARAEDGEARGGEPFIAPEAPGVAALVPLQHSPSRSSRREHSRRAVQADSSRAEAMRPLIQRHAEANGLPYSLADAIVRVESRYNSSAHNGPNIGLTQINARTARSLGYGGSASGLYDADTNLRYGLQYLAQAYRLAGGDTCGTILRYQSGHRATHMTGAARTYCSKVKTIIASR